MLIGGRESASTADFRPRFFGEGNRRPTRSELAEFLSRRCSSAARRKSLGIIVVLRKMDQPYNEAVLGQTPPSRRKSLAGSRVPAGRLTRGASSRTLRTGALGKRLRPQDPAGRRCPDGSARRNNAFDSFARVRPALKNIQGINNRFREERPLRRTIFRPTQWDLLS
jgi:hypothetical protein